jgi:predicted hydrocarbon binding protein
MDELKSFMVKGAPVIADIAYIRTRHGDEGLDRVFAEMPEDYAAICRKTLLPGSWYTMDFRISILLAVDKVFAKGDPDYYFKLGRHQAEHNLNTVYKAFSRVMGDSATARMSRVFWSQIYKTSYIETSVGKSSFEMEIFEYPKIGEYNCHVVRGYIHGALELTGSKKMNVRSSEPQCLNRGDHHCRFVFNWT